ncbi:MAG: YoaK family protein [Treponema sp.]|uniref:YoaK family protein n=1 Tax=Treponema sp. TaxID=166 RepID=UPI003FA26327
MVEKQNISIKVLINLLTFLAGFVNGVFFITAGTAVSHHTGNLTRFAVKLSKGAADETIAMLLLLLAFGAGAGISGIIFPPQTLNFAKRYGVVLLIFAAVFLGIAIVRPTMPTALVLTCIVLGLQNGIFIPYNGVLIRTSHFTGYLTDAGRTLGLLLCGHKREMNRGLLYLSGIVCFTAGAGFAAFLPSASVYYMSALLYFLAAWIYFIFRIYSDKPNHR